MLTFVTKTSEMHVITKVLSNYVVYKITLGTKNQESPQMGLSSSQARLLNLTTRMHQIEYKAAKLESEKLQMANESRRVYLDYQNALEATKIQLKTLNVDGSTTYRDIKNYADFCQAGYYLGLDTETGFTTYKEDQFQDLCEELGIKNPDTSNFEELLTNIINSGEVSIVTKQSENMEFNNYQEFLDAGYCFATYGGQDFKGAYNAVSDYRWLIEDTGITPSNFKTEFKELLNRDDVDVVRQRNDGSFASESDADYNNYVVSKKTFKKDIPPEYYTSVATNTGLQEVADETGLRKAEAKYEADMKRIDSKDKKFDYDLAALDNERNAIKQEMETLKTVAKDNVERTFKLFS